MREEHFWENLLRILNRGSWTMTGDEMKVFSYIQNHIEAKIKVLKTPPAPPAPISNPTVVSPIKQSKKPKKSV